ncbi:histidinol-phosphate transaminase [Flaviflexus huanghaiensis]|uniref:histidinol-phosphate transaminase n=1 Tax=Flaviflexus huanghaiensis TaxID=1111473 RepID=UPI0015F7E1BD|nr:histidinol-phosphate transaminase [Flaviflexus huanghaiensis]
MSLFRHDLSRIPPYVPGKPGGDPSVIKLSSNEMAYGPLPSVQAVIAQGIGSLHMYPDMYASELSAKLAAFHGVPADSIVPSNGSVAMIEKILTAVCSPGSEVIIAWRSFEAYPIAITVAGGTAVTVPLTPEGGHDLDAMADAVSARTAAVMVCSPNNPTGVALTHGELSRFLTRVGDDVLVVLDEAYVDFVRMVDPVRSVDLLANHPNLIILRTFSKAYSLAGLRVGYAIARPEVAATLRAVATPFGVNALAQSAAIAALDEVDEVRMRTDFVTAERMRVAAELDELGLLVPDSQANFVWLEMADTQPFVDAAARCGITVRAFPGDGVRVSVGSTAANERILSAARLYTAR